MRRTRRSRLPATSSCRSCAGPELSVAATKTFIATAAALARLTAAWAEEEGLQAALERLPQRLAAAAALDWSAALPALSGAASLVTIGRGPTLAIAREAALKLKEICNRHAEAFSGAEFLHGPVALVSSRYPILMFMPTDAAAEGMQQLAIGPAQEEQGAVHRRAGRRRRGTTARARSRSARGRCHLPDPELLRHGRAAGAAPGYGRRPAAALEQGDPHHMSEAQLHAVAATTVFDGSTAVADAAVVIEGDRVVAVTPRRELPAGIAVRSLPDGAWLAPGFIDVQVNGGGDVLFNDEPTAEGIAAIAAAHRRYGTTALLPTLISDTPEKMRTALAAARSAAAANPGILGIHLEGPFLSPEKPGVHDLKMFRAPRARGRSSS